MECHQQQRISEILRHFKSLMKYDFFFCKIMENLFKLHHFFYKCSIQIDLKILMHEISTESRTSKLRYNKNMMYLPITYIVILYAMCNIKRMEEIEYLQEQLVELPIKYRRRKITTTKYILYIIFLAILLHHKSQ